MKTKAPRNRTLDCPNQEMELLSKNLLQLNKKINVNFIQDKIINQDINEAILFLPEKFVDLMIIDPPYNLTKNYHGNTFKSKNSKAYINWFENILKKLLYLLKENASIYVCSEWRTSNLIFPILENYFFVQNRITWEREKGRGAKSNWKNNSEDIWFCTRSKDYYFNVESVKLKRKVLAPYREHGTPKDWKEESGGNYRMTCPSNLWTDISVPFWSMPENTDHPTQKSEKLIAKLMLASSREGGFVFDPFLGSGSTVVVASKLNRRFSGVELNREYCCWALKRLEQAKTMKSIQGYVNGVFWERNAKG